MIDHRKTRDQLILESILLRKRVDELRAAELSCVRAEKALQDEERFLENVLDSIQDGISVLDKNMNILRVNPAMGKWYAHAMPLVGKKCYQAYHSRTLPCEICPTQKTLKTGKAAYEVVPKCGPKGVIVGWLDLYSFPLVDSKTGKIEGVIEYVRDITERKMAEERLAELNEELMESNRKLRDLSLIDPHTGLYNHRYLAEAIETEFYRARRYSYPLSLMMIDIDYFKSVNDIYGHKFGDRVLREFASQLKKTVRRYDMIVRYGGEEFVIIAPSTEKYRIRILAGRIQTAVNSCDFGDRKQRVKLKTTIAVSSYPEDIDIGKGMDLVAFTERVLNKAKQAGGNRVFTTEDAEISGRHRQISPAGRENKEIVTLKERIEKLTKSGNESVTEAIFAFAKTIEAKDHYTGAHTEKTVRYAVNIAKAFNFPKEELSNIEKAAMLHDLGKVGVSERILGKKGKLTPREYREIKKHPRIGANILRSIHFMHDIVPLVLYHHERWDGKGYPMGLKGLEIPLGARIIAIADVYEALTSRRPYRKAYPPARAIRIIKEGSGTQFDPAVVEKFLKVLHKERTARRR
jgi:diguanylate cyclase (GGDEF)-like protein